jgi:hypothetical protein
MSNKGLCTNWFYCDPGIEYLSIRTLDEAVSSASEWYNNGQTAPSELREMLLNGEVLSYEGYDGNGYLSNKTVYHKNTEELLRYLAKEKEEEGYLPVEICYTESIPLDYKDRLDRIILTMGNHLVCVCQ